jgi:hypothetical protein
MLLVVLVLSVHLHPSQGGPLPLNLSSLPYATPNFLSRLVALAKFVRLSLPKAA